MKHSALALLVVAASLTACQKSDSDSVVFVNVSAANGVTGVTQLRATITLGLLSDAENFPPANSGVALVLPTSFSLTMPRARQGAISVGITAVDAAGTPLAAGQDGKSLVTGGTRDFPS